MPYRSNQLAAESVQRTSRGGYKAFNHSDPTADAAIRNVEQDALLDFLMDAGENYAKEYVLRKHGYQNKEIAALLNRSASSITRDFKTVDKLVDAFYADWNSYFFTITISQLKYQLVQMILYLFRQAHVCLQYSFSGMGHFPSAKQKDQTAVQPFKYQSSTGTIVMTGVLFPSSLPSSAALS